MGSYRGNIPKAEAEVDLIVRRLRTSPVTLTAIRREYHINPDSLKHVLLTKITARQYKAIVTKKKQNACGPTQFKKGHQGYRCPKGVRPSPATEFRKGHLPESHKHTGSISVRNDKCGKQFRWIKVSGIRQGTHKWIPYARHIWAEEHGPIPPGRFVVHFSTDTLDDDLPNLRLVNRQQHLELQMARDPKMVKRMRKNASKAAKRRHARNRKVKRRLTVEQARQAKKVAGQIAEDNDHRQIFESQIGQFRGPRKAWWECTGCGHETSRPRPPCPKCGHLAFERIERSVECACEEAVG